MNTRPVALLTIYVAFPALFWFALILLARAIFTAVAS